ncbi:MAG: hypothetical protein BZY88_12685 [SAR202 cluster bacterium Io17-Chloro-G9]|nr:MAG: hypothetical protein BZY88_12685 [SAR202 cluster bacterium Io17-Chloro-G9]
MPLGAVALEAVRDYMQLRGKVAKRNSALWVSQAGKVMRPQGLRIMLRRLVDDAGVPGLHGHRFRHTYAVNALRSGISDRLVMLNGGWKKIPETYFRTLGFEDVARKHREISLADKLWQIRGEESRRRQPIEGGGCDARGHHCYRDIALGKSSGNFECHYPFILRSDFVLPTKKCP